MSTKFLKYFSICAFCFSFLLCVIAVAVGKINNTRDGLIVDIPITAFDEQGNLVDTNWKRYLQTRKPVGVIFFQQHFPNKNVATNIIKNVKDAIDTKTLLCADEEGGRINRMDWLQVPSAETIAQHYIKIKNTNGQQEAIKYVKQQYIPMFIEMQELGLNTTFAPNLDLNKYADLQIGTAEYKHYQTCAKYATLWRISPNDASFKMLVNPLNYDIKDYNNSLLFLIYLNEIGKRKISDQTFQTRPELQQAQQTWNTLDKKQKQQLTKEFKPLAKYANYTAVVGDRSYGNDVKIVGEIAKIFVQTAKEYGITCVAKHALGHGRVDGDTHLGKQILNATEAELLHDIQPYLAIKNEIKFIMPSHIIYSAIDKENSAVHSTKVLDFIKQHIKKDIIFITDDISMEGNDNSKKSPCDLWIIAHKDIEDIQKLGRQNKINIEQSKRIFASLI